jgi:hypothetical protein
VIPDAFPLLSADGVNVNVRRSQVCEPRFRLLMLRREAVVRDDDVEEIEERWGVGAGEDDNECFRVHELNYEIHSMENRFACSHSRRSFTV